MPRRPTDEQFDIAIGWLEVNEGEGGEAEACKAVAAWLAKQQDKYIENVTVRKLAKEKGTDPMTVRWAMRKS